MVLVKFRGWRHMYRYLRDNGWSKGGAKEVVYDNYNDVPLFR